MLSKHAKGWQTLDNNLQVHYSGQGYMQVMDKVAWSSLDEHSFQEDKKPSQQTKTKQEWQTDENGLEYKIFPFRMLSLNRNNLKLISHVNIICFNQSNGKNVAKMNIFLKFGNKNPIVV